MLSTSVSSVLNGNAPSAEQIGQQPTPAIGDGRVLDPIHPNELLVKFRRGTNRAIREAALARVAARLRHFEDTNLGRGGRRGPPVLDQLAHVVLAPDVSLDDAIAELRRDRDVEYAEPNYLVQALATVPNDVDFASLWGLSNSGQTGGTIAADIDAPSAWDMSTGRTDVVVAVIDTGIDYSHPDLAANMWSNYGEIPGNGLDDDGNGYVDDVHGYDFYNDDGDPDDDNFHGTHCAGTIGAVGDNGIGVAGVNWAVRLMALKFLNGSGAGTSAGAIAAIQYAVNNGAQVLSNSWGGGDAGQALQDVILDARQAGVVVVAAAGNNGSDTLVYPAAYAGVIAVSATDHNDAKAGFSSYGAFVDVAAPGVNILSTKLNGSYGLASGTSMAAPHVSGLAGLLLAANATLAPEQVEAVLESSAEDLGSGGWDTYYGAGRINAYQALQTVAQQGAELPLAAITSPSQGAHFAGTELEVVGSASGAGFVDYTLELAPRDGSSWELVASGTTPVENGSLGVLDTSGLEDGDYLIRLTVGDATSRRFHDVVMVTIDNFATRISFPGDLVSLGSVDILGSAATQNGLPFGSYTLEWGTGSAPDVFSTAGISLPADGLAPITDGTLATWDTSGLTDGQTYTLRLTVHSAIGLSTEARLATAADRTLVGGWPRIIDFDTRPSIADLDGDGDKEIIVAGRNSAEVHAYRKDGSQLPGFPAPLGSDVVRFTGEGNVTVVDVDGDGSREILAGALRQDSQGYGYGLYLIGADGAPYPGWTVPRFSRSPLVPVAVDMDGDGSEEIVTIEIARWALGYSDYTVHAFDLRGNEITGFPVVQSIDDIAGSAQYFSVHDLDGDRYPELALLQNDTMLLFDHRGELIPGWPHRVPARADGDLLWFDGVMSSGDIDGDGQGELVAMSSKSCTAVTPTSYLCTIGTYASLYAWNGDGTVAAGFPRTTDSDGFVSWLSTAVPVADIDGDGSAEVLAGSDPFMIFAGDGNLVTELPLRSAGPLGLVDIDGDGVPEYASGKSRLQVFDQTGTVLWSRNVGEDLHYSGMLLADLDGDGAMEVVKALPGVNPETGRVDPDYYHLYVWTLEQGSSTVVDWPMFAQNPHRDANGTAIRGGDGGGDTVPPTVTILSPLDGSTALAGTEVVIAAQAFDDGTGVDRVEFAVDGELICVVDSAPYTCTTTLTAGDHELKAVAVDGAGNRQSHVVTISCVPVDTTAPIVAVTTPADGATLVASREVAIEAEASDPESGIAQVEFFVDGAPACTIGSAPYRCSVVLAPGAHELTATALNQVGIGGSDSVDVVSQLPDVTPPSVAITSPSDGANLHPRGALRIEASATDADSGVSRVEFLVDGVIVCSLTASPHACETQVGKGDHELTARAFDRAGNSAHSSIFVSRGNGRKR